MFSGEFCDEFDILKVIEESIRDDKNSESCGNFATEGGPSEDLFRKNEDHPSTEGLIDWWVRTNGGEINTTNLEIGEPTFLEFFGTEGGNGDRVRQTCSRTDFEDIYPSCSIDDRNQEGLGVMGKRQEKLDSPKKASPTDNASTQTSHTFTSYAFINHVSTQTNHTSTSHASTQIPLFLQNDQHSHSQPKAQQRIDKDHSEVLKQRGEEFDYDPSSPQLEALADEMGYSIRKVSSYYRLCFYIIYIIFS